MKSIYHCLVTTLAFLFPMAPSSAITGPDDDALKAPLKITWYDWKADGAPVTLPPVATHICLLTAISGKFAGPGEVVRLWIDGGAAGGARYMLGGASGQKELSGSAACAPRAQFSPVTMMINPGVEQVFAGGSISTTCAGYRSPVSSKASVNAFFLSSVGGNLRGAGESVSATTTPTGVGAVQVTACSGFARGAILSVTGFLMRPVKFRTDQGFSTDATTATVQLSTGLGGKTAFLARVDEALCGLVAVSGKFNGYGEVVDVYPGTAVPGGARWVLMTHSSSGDSPFVSAATRCYARDQR